MEGGGGTEADSCESEKGTLSRGLRGANDASSTSESGSESHSSPGSESGAERGSERGLISDSESVIMAMTVAVAKAGFKGRLHVLREVIMRKKALNFINRVRRSNNLQHLAQRQQLRYYNYAITAPCSQGTKLQDQIIL